MNPGIHNQRTRITTDPHFEDYTGNTTDETDRSVPPTLKQGRSEQEQFEELSSRKVMESSLTFTDETLTETQLQYE